MEFDIYTAVLSNIISSIAAFICVLLILAQNHRERKAMRSLLYYVALLCCGGILVLFRNFLPAIITITLANFMMLLSRAFLLETMGRLYGKKINYRATIIILVLVNLALAYFTFIRVDPFYKLLFFAAGSILLHLQIILFVTRKDISKKSGKNLLIGVMSTYITLNLIMIIVITFYYDTTGHYLEQKVDSIAVMISGVFILVIVLSILSVVNKKNIRISEVNAKKALMAEKQKNTIISNIPGFTYRCKLDKDWTMLELSDGFTELTGYDAEALIHNRDISFNDIINEEYREYVWDTWNDCFERNVPFVGEYKINKADGNQVWIWEHGRYIDTEKSGDRILEGFITDINDRKALEEQAEKMEVYMQNQQKLEAVGTLAAGIAHEINNPMNGIMNYAQLISETKDIDSESEGYAKEIIRESERVSKIVRGLLSFSGNQDMGPQIIEMQEPFMQTIELFKSTIMKDNIVINVSADQDIPLITCDCSKMQQVLMNLLTNAKDALNKKYEDFNENKIINVSAGVYDDEDGQWLRIIVEDFGTGIPDEAKDHIFEPFFTTKGRARGTGLGLAISYGIITEHKGRLTFETEVGEYTRFYMDLPV